MSKTYRKGAQLSSTTLLPDGQDLRYLAGNTEDASAGLQVAQGLHVKQVLREQGTNAAREDRDEQSGQAGAATVVEHQDGDDDVLAHDQGSLAKGAKGEAIAHVVGQRDEVRARLEEVGEEGDSLGGPGADELEDLGHLDDGRGGNDADAEALGDAELQTLDIFEVNVEEDGTVALLADDGDAQVADGRGEVVRDGLNG